MSVDPATRTVFDYDHGISAVDAGYHRPMLAAVHLTVEDGRAAIVDTAHGASVPRVIAALRAKVPGLPAIADAKTVFVGLRTLRNSW